MRPRPTTTGITRWLAVLAMACGLATGVASVGPGTVVASQRGQAVTSARSVLLDPDHAAWRVAAPNLYRVRFETSKGTFVLEVDRRWAPHGTDRFYNLVRLGFYDDTRFYRVREGFIAQFGLSGDPDINAAWYSRTMPDDPVRRSNTRGMVAFAMLESPDSRTTQLFINLDDNSRLDEQRFAPLARVVQGMQVVDSLYAGYDEAAGGGMRGGNQGRIVAGGNAHLDTEFPHLDRIDRARIEPGRIMRYPDVGGNRIRVEQHLLPAVTTGPLDPAWSPDGAWIAFSMRGDIWKVPSDGGTAIALTRGPAYHFEPAWSPDGSRVVMSIELDGNLDIGVVDADGGDTRRLTGHPHVDVQPTWSRDGSRVLFASARGDGFDIWSVPVAGGAPVPLLVGRGHQIQPAVSPAGDRLAFVSPLRGRIGTGGVWSTPLPRSAATISDPRSLLERAEVIHFEETSYRARPAWTADGRGIVFVSDAAGSNDLAVVATAGGSRAYLTQDAGGELSPTVSPDGTRIAFVSNRDGAQRLYTAPAGGARRQGWRLVPIARSTQQPTGRVRILVHDAAGSPLPARIFLTASDGRTYAPDGGFHKMIGATDTHYFHIDGPVEVEVPVGPVSVEAMHGYEYVPARGGAEITAGGTRTIVLKLTRAIDAPARGWYSGETHAHDLHQGRHGLDHARFLSQLIAEDLHATNALIHMDGTRIMGRWADLTGEPHPLSTADHILQYAQEFRGSFGHVGLLGVSELVMPLIGGTADTRFAADVLNADYLDAAVAQGGVGGFMHPYTRRIPTPEDGAGSEIAVDVALGKGAFFDVACIWYDELANAEMYYRFLNAGFRLAATGGSDNFADVWRDPPPGTARTYARLDGPLTMPAWLQAVAAGRTFASTGPLLFLQVDGRGPGEQIGLQGDRTLPVNIDVTSVTPLRQVEIIANGEVVHTVDARGMRGSMQVRHSVSLPQGGWIAARATGPAARPLSDSYAFAQTSPVWVVRDGQPYRSTDDARFLAAMVRAYWQRIDQRDRFGSEVEREHVRAAVQTAIRIYEERAQNGSTSR